MTKIRNVNADFLAYIAVREVERAIDSELTAQEKYILGKQIMEGRGAYYEVPSKINKKAPATNKG